MFFKIACSAIFFFLFFNSAFAQDAIIPIDDILSVILYEDNGDVVVEYDYISDKEKPFLKDEIKELRTQSSITRDLSKNHFVQTRYGSPVQYLKDDKWYEIESATSTIEDYEKLIDEDLNIFDYLIPTAEASVSSTRNGAYFYVYAWDYGSIVWTAPYNAQTLNGNPTIADMTTGGSPNYITHALRGTNFGFNIPSSTIDGIEMTIYKKIGVIGAPEAYCKDDSVRIMYGGEPHGDNKANTGTNWETYYASSTYGGSTDLWNSTATITWQGINENGFGLSIMAVGRVVRPGIFYYHCQIDTAYLSVYFTPSTSTIVNVIKKADFSYYINFFLILAFVIVSFVVVSFYV